MAARKPTPDTKRTRALAKELDRRAKELVTESDKEDADLLKKSARWDGAEQEALELMSIVMTTGQYSLDEKRKLIAARLRKIAQGPRKWGVLR